MAERLDQASFTRRLKFASTLMSVAVALLMMRLWYLQCVYGGYYRDLSENNRVRTIRTVPPRGVIYDRNDQVLVRNRPAFHVALIMEDVPSVPETLTVLAQITGRDEALLLKQLQTPGKTRHFEPRIVMEDISRDELAKIKVNSYRLPGVIIKTVPARAYPNGALASQVLGYAREITRAQLESAQGKADYKTGDLVGQAGVEKEWEDTLRGQSGYIQVEVDARGHRRGELGIEADQIGDDLLLNLDADLQRVAEEALGTRRGAVVAIDPNNGEILVLASAPAVDANLFSGKMNAKDWDDILTDRSKPLANRAIASKYPPGSTFKLFAAVAGLATKKITPQTIISCPGYYTLGGHPYKCNKRTGHGPVNLEQAITVSCNAYFYSLGQELGITQLEKFAGMFGFGSVTGIEIPGEDPGILPSEKWKQDTYGERWYPGDTIPVSIGQGYLNVTPLQITVALAAIANGGKVYRPHLVKRVVSHRTGEVKDFSPEVVRELDVDPSILATVRQFATSVVSSPHGTGKRSAIPGISIAGKTGTAQTGALGKESLGESFKDHAWFISFAPAEKPLIAMAVIVENSGHGGEFAAPVAKTVYEAFFRKRGMLAPLPDAAEGSILQNPQTNGAAAANSASSSHDETGSEIDSISEEEEGD